MNLKQPYISLRVVALEKEQEVAYRKEDASKKYLYGIRGIAQLQKCCRSKVIRANKSGVIGQAIIQNGRKIIADDQLDIQLMKNSN